MRLSDPATNWSFECLIDSSGNPLPGGLVLRDVRHQGHNLAKDVRLIGFWLTFETVDPPGRVAASATPPRFYVLDSTNFTISPISVLTPKSVASPAMGRTFDFLLKEADAALSFTDYFKESDGNYVAYGVTTKFDAPTLLNSLPNCEFAGLTVEEIFLFSRYGNSPKHEPSGGLSAARFHPMVRYAFAKNASYDKSKRFTRVVSIRFDYRLHLKLDRHYDMATNAGLAQIGNQAGLFADSDSAITTAFASVKESIWNLFRRKKDPWPSGLSSGSFYAVEKPLVLEVTAPGLEKGFPVFATTASNGTPLTLRCWDNVHWWGRRDLLEPLIATPGAFHAAHIHWRWGAAAKVAPGAYFDPRFNPKGMASNLRSGWGPLVDPGIWMQSIRIAITKNEARLDPARGASLGNLSKADWKTLFNPGLRSVPDNILAGDDIVFWYSTEVHSEVTPLAQSRTFRAAPSGTVFIHGLFFAHDSGKTGFTVGTTDPLYSPKDFEEIHAAKSWFRAAD